MGEAVMGRPRKPTSGIQYDGCTRIYHFVGERLPEPDPSTYDASKWTPPSHRRYDVHMQGDGIWVLLMNGAQVTSGDARLPSRANARKIVIDYRAKFGPLAQQEAGHGSQDQD